MSNAVLLSDAEFRELFDKEIRFTRETLAKSRTDNILPRLTVVGPQRENPRAVVVYALVGSMNGAKEKRKLFAALGTRCYEDEIMPLAAFFATEVWCSKQTQLPPSEALDREESVMITGRTIDGKEAFALAPIFRDHDRVIRLGKFTLALGETRSFLLQGFFESFMRTGYGDLKKKGLL